MSLTEWMMCSKYCETPAYIYLVTNTNFSNLFLWITGLRLFSLYSYELIYSSILYKVQYSAITCLGYC